jgi:hypothetical protein
MRRAVPLWRSDDDRSSTALRLSRTTSFTKWIPYTGTNIGEQAVWWEAPSTIDMYNGRASYLTYFFMNFVWRAPSMPYATLRKLKSEWDTVKGFLLKDYYVLTPWNNRNETVNWTAHEYYDRDTDKGVIQIFRPQDSTQNKMTLPLKGIDPKKNYKLTDTDGINSIKAVTGAELIGGFEFRLASARQAAVIFIEPLA